MLLSQFTANLLAQPLIITEFMAVNNSGERDEDGDFSDWIEIYNQDQQPASLTGWFLTDDAKNLVKWQFPALTLPGQGLFVVFASGKDRRDPKGKLHANFKLSGDGEYLALIKPDGKTVATEFAPAYPRQLSDVSYGRGMLTQTESLVPPESMGQMLVPDDAGHVVLMVRAAASLQPSAHIVSTNLGQSSFLPTL